MNFDEGNWLKLSVPNAETECQSQSSYLRRFKHELQSYQPHHKYFHLLDSRISIETEQQLHHANSQCHCHMMLASRVEDYKSCD